MHVSELYAHVNSTHAEFRRRCEPFRTRKFPKPVKRSLLDDPFFATLFFCCCRVRVCTIARTVEHNGSDYIILCITEQGSARNRFENGKQEINIMLCVQKKMISESSQCCRCCISLFRFRTCQSFAAAPPRRSQPFLPSDIFRASSICGRTC